MFDCWDTDAEVRGCAAIGADGQPHLTPSYRTGLRYGPHDLAAVGLSRSGTGGAAQWFYVRRDGVMAPVMTYDNGPENFPYGLARSPVGARIGYIDQKLNLVIPARYDGAYPFENGFAVVCLDCKIVSGGEHSWYEGGTWGCIDRNGKERAPLRLWFKEQRFDELCRAPR